MNKEKIPELLRLFVSTDNFRPKIQHPWRDGKFIYATDTHVLIRINGALSDEEYPTGGPNVDSFKWDLLPTGEISAADIDAALSKVPLVDEMEIIGEDIECPECNGEGEVYWEYSHWSELFECPVCDGTGYSERKRSQPSGRKVYDPVSTLRISRQYFRSELIYLIRQAMTLVGVESVRASINNANQPSLIIIHNDIRVLIMPCLPRSISDFHAEIPLAPCGLPPDGR